MCYDSRYSLRLVHFRYTGSYNYGSYGNQHPHPLQNQYPALPHDTAISGPLHYSPYHRSSAQVSVRVWGGGLADSEWLAPSQANDPQLISPLCVYL